MLICTGWAGKSGSLFSACLQGVCVCVCLSPYITPQFTADVIHLIKVFLLYAPSPFLDPQPHASVFSLPLRGCVLVNCVACFIGAGSFIPVWHRAGPLSLPPCHSSLVLRSVRVPP